MNLRNRPVGHSNSARPDPKHFLQSGFGLVVVVIAVIPEVQEIKERQDQRGKGTNEDHAFSLSDLIRSCFFCNARTIFISTGDATMST